MPVVTGGGGGHHRGRVTAGPGGAHWWGGTGPAGGGTHAVRRAGRRGLVLLVVLVPVLVAGGVVLAVALTRGPEPAPASAGSRAQPSPPAPVATGPLGGAPAVRASDVATLRAAIDGVLATTPLRFPADSATPDPAASASVERLAAAMLATPGPPITVEGHTAPAGEDTGGAQRLSQQRADEIRRRLESAGVPPERLRAVGVGPARPLATLEASRRVEIRAG